MKQRSFGQIHQPIEFDPGYEVSEVTWAEWQRAVWEAEAPEVRAWAETQTDNLLAGGQ